jgi:hypothetical protein
MAYYQCKFFDANERMLCTEDVDAETDQQALEKVRRRFAPIRNPFELWRGAPASSRKPLSRASGGEPDKREPAPLGQSNHAAFRLDAGNVSLPRRPLGVPCEFLDGIALARR